jgi:hypothetical protein
MGACERSERSVSLRRAGDCHVLSLPHAVQGLREEVSSRVR